jgi:N-acetylglucosamine-6-phosphate deacetylase
VKTFVAAALGALALMVAAPASADDQEFLNVVAELGISAHHGHIGDHHREDRSTLNSGRNICRNLHNGYSVMDAQRMLLTNSHTRRAMDENPITPSQVYALVEAAQRYLCPDTL